MIASDHLQNKINDLQESVTISIDLGKTKTEHQGARLRRILGGDGVGDLGRVEVAHHLAVGGASPKEGAWLEAGGGEEGIFVGCRGLEVRVGVCGVVGEEGNCDLGLFRLEVKS